MTRHEAELMMIESDIENLTQQMSSQTDWMMRQAEEMKQAVERGYDLTCHASNLTSAATELAVMSARLDTLHRAKKAMANATKETV